MLFGDDGWVEKLFNFGLPTVILFAFFVASYKVGLWFKSKVVEPILHSHLQLMDTLKEHIPKQTEAINRQTEVLLSRTELFDKILEKEDQIIKKIDKKT